MHGKRSAKKSKIDFGDFKKVDRIGSKICDWIERSIFQD